MNSNCARFRAISRRNWRKIRREIVRAGRTIYLLLTTSFIDRANSRLGKSRSKATYRSTDVADFEIVPANKRWLVAERDCFSPHRQIQSVRNSRGYLPRWNFTFHRAVVERANWLRNGNSLIFWICVRISRYNRRFILRSSRYLRVFHFHRHVDLFSYRSVFYLLHHSYRNQFYSVRLIQRASKILPERDSRNKDRSDTNVSISYRLDCNLLYKL